MQNAIEYRAAWEDAEARGRPHVGIGMVTGRESHFPVLSLTVKGSLHNAKTFRYVASKLQGRLTAVMDRGFMNKYAVAIASEAGIDVLGGCIENSNEVKDALMKWRDDEIERPGQVIARSSGSVLYYREWTGKLFGRKGLIVVTLDTSRRSEERGKTVKGKEGKGRRSDGRCLLFTTDTGLPTEEVVEAYFQRGEVEKAFREMKGRNTMEPIRYRLWNRVDAYLTVVNHLAYLLRAAARWRLLSAGRRESVDEAIEMLKGIYEVSVVSNGKAVRQLGPLTKESTKLVKDIGLEELIPSY